MAPGVEIEITETVDEITHTDANLPYDNEDGSIRWTMQPTSGFLIKPDINLHLNISVQKVVGSSAPVNLTDDDEMCLTNYPLMSLFKSADIEINQKPIIPAKTSTAYTAQIRALQEFDKDGRNGVLSRSLWHQDLPGYHNLPGKQSTEPKNDPYLLRHDPITDGKKVDLYGPLMLDIFRQPQPFPDDVEIRVTLHMQKTSFVLNGPEPPLGTYYKIVIHKADLCFNRLRMPPNTDVYAKVGPNIKYPFVSYETRHFSESKEINTISKEILAGPIPNRIIFLFLDHEAFTGKYSLNGFNFEHFAPRNIFLRKNQIITIPTDAFTTEVNEVPRTKTKAEQKADAEKERLRLQGQQGQGQQGQQGQQGNKQSRDEPRHRKRVRYEIDEEELERLVRKRMRQERHRHKRARDDYATDKDSDEYRYKRYRRDEPAPTTRSRLFDPDKELALKNYSRLYVESMKVLNNFDSLNRVDIGVTYEDFARGYFMLAFNLQADRVQRTNKVQMPMMGVIRLEMIMHELLRKPILILAILEYQRVLTIPKDKSHEITVE